MYMRTYVECFVLGFHSRWKKNNIFIQLSTGSSSLSQNVISYIGSVHFTVKQSFPINPADAGTNSFALSKHFALSPG